MRTFFRKAVKVYAAKYNPAPQSVQTQIADRDDSAEKMQLALLNVLGQKSLKQQLDEFDMAAEMKRIGLSVCLFDCLYAWPGYVWSGVLP